MADPHAAVIADMRASFERLQQMVADLHPTDEADPAKAELVADLKRELESLRVGSSGLKAPSTSSASRACSRLTGMPSITILAWIGLALGAALGAVVGVLWEGGAGFGVGVAVGAGLGVSAGTLVNRRRPRHSQ